MKKYLTLCLFIILLPVLRAQNAYIRFDSTNVSGYVFGDASPCSDGGILTATIQVDAVYVPHIQLEKTDGSGALLWSNRYDMPGASNVYGVSSVSELNDHTGYYMTGTYFDSNINAYSFFLKIDLNGTVTVSAVYALGSGFTYLGSRVLETPAGNFVVMPSIQSMFVVLMLDASGNLLWDRKFSLDPVFAEKNPGIDMCISPEGNILLVGKYNINLLIVSLSPSGNLRWNLHDTTAPLNMGTCCIPAPGGGYYVGGLANLGGFLLRVSEFGNVIWYKEYPAMDMVSALVASPNGELLIAGTASYANGFSSCVFRADTAGNLISGNLYQTGTADFTYEMVLGFHLGSAGGLLLFNNFNDADANANVRIIRTDAAFHVPCLSSPLSGTVTVGTLGYTLLDTLYITSGFASAVACSTIVATSIPSYFTVCSGPLSVPAENPETFSVYPNPVSSGGMLKLNLPSGAESVQMMSADGKIILQSVMNGETSMELSVGTLAPGLYLLSVTRADGSVITLRKIIIE